MPFQQPDGFRADGNLKQVSDTKKISYGITEPNIKNNQDLWFEPSGFPQPWEWDSSTSRWRSNPQAFDMFLPSNTAGSVRIDKICPIGTSFIWLESYAVMLSTRGSGTIDTNLNYWTCVLEFTNTSGTVFSITSSTGGSTSSNNQGATLNSLRRVGGNIFQYLTNPVSISATFTRNGSTTGLTLLAGVNFRYKFVR